MGDPDPPLEPAVDAVEVARVADALRTGGAAVLPTDTVYGLAALASEPGATERLFALKGRRPDVPLAVLVADRAAGVALADGVGDDVLRIMAAFWPGPLTLVLRRGPVSVAWDLGGDGATIGVRCPAHPLVRAIAAEVGPLATTSANRHGASTPATAAEAAGSLVGPVEVVVDGGRIEGTASTVLDVTGPTWRVLRDGPVSLDRLRAAAERPLPT